MSELSYTPYIKEVQPGFNIVLDRMRQKKKLTSVKLNHAIWEMLVKLENKGVNRSNILSYDKKKLDEIIGISEKKKSNNKSLGDIIGSKSIPFWQTGIMHDVLNSISDIPSYKEGMVFIPSLIPWPKADILSGTPNYSYYRCMELIEYFTDGRYLLETSSIGLTGNEFKSSVISGHFWEFHSLLVDRDIFIIANEDAINFFRSTGINSSNVYITGFSGARLERHEIKKALFKWLEANQGNSPIVVTSSGEALCTWLGFEVFKVFEDVQFIDLGGAMAAFSPTLSVITPWVKTYSKCMLDNIDRWPLKVSKEMKPILEKISGNKRLPKINRLASNYGIKSSVNLDYLYQKSKDSISFVEGKYPSIQRITDYITSSGNASKVKRGNVFQILEEAVRLLLNLPNHLNVIAVANEAIATKLAFEAASISLGKRKEITWLSSPFSPLSKSVETQVDIQAVDCDVKGTFDIAKYIEQ